MNNKYLHNIILLISFFFASQLHAQKHDYNWIMGGDPPRWNTHYPFILSFNTHPPHLESRKNKLSLAFSTTCSMSDSSGNLAFYTNGLHIFNRMDTIMQYGDTINPGFMWKIDFEQFGDYGHWILPQAIPLPGQRDQYLIFHLGYDYNPVFSLQPLYASRIDMLQNNGLGAVIEKNVIIGSKENHYQDFAITKHANGRDWWCIITHDSGQVYTRYLVSPKGIQRFERSPLVLDKKEIITAITSRFSPDGRTLAMLTFKNPNYQYSLIICDFDRCTGSLTFRKRFSFHFPKEGNRFIRPEFSPDGRYVYILNTYELYQIDLYNDVEDSISRYIVAESDVYRDYFITPFFLPQLAPDGKIYCTPGNRNRVLHVINRPNLPGLSCDVSQHNLRLLDRNGVYLGIPIFPNYRLKALEDSPCDTIRTPVHIPVIDSLNGDFQINGVWYKHIFKP